MSKNFRIPFQTSFHLFHSYGNVFCSCNSSISGVFSTLKGSFILLVVSLKIAYVLLSSSASFLFREISFSILSSSWWILLGYPYSHVCINRETIFYCIAVWWNSCYASPCDFIGSNLSSFYVLCFSKIFIYQPKSERKWREVLSFLEALRSPDGLINFFLNTGTLDAIVKMIHYEGLGCFYKGMSTKIVQSVFAASVLFMIKEELVKAFALVAKSQKISLNITR